MTDNPKAKLEVAATIEDILKPLMAAARFTGITEHPRWDIYAIQVAVKNVDKLGIIQIYANVRWPYIAANDQHMLKRGPEINLADPDSYPLIRASLIKQIEGGDMLSTW